MYNHLAIAFEDFKHEINGKVFLVCDTDPTLDSNTSYIKNDSQHPKLRYRRLINNETHENTELVMINSPISSSPTVLEDALNAETFLKVLDQKIEQHPELVSLIEQGKRVETTQGTFYPSGLCLMLSVPEKRILRTFFGKNNNHMKVEFAEEYIQNINNIDEIPWINEIRHFFTS